METYNAWVLWMQQHSVIAVMSVFLLIVAWAYWPSHKQAIEQRGSIPLTDDPQE